MYLNMKYYENICNCLRVIQQYINRKLKSANCWQRTSLIEYDAKCAKLGKLEAEIWAVGPTGPVVSVANYGPRGPWFEPGRSTVCCGLEQVTFTHCLVLVKPRKPWTDD